MCPMSLMLMRGHVTRLKRRISACTQKCCNLPRQARQCYGRIKKWSEFGWKEKEGPNVSLDCLCLKAWNNVWCSSAGSVLFIGSRWGEEKGKECWVLLDVSVEETNWKALILQNFNISCIAFKKSDRWLPWHLLLSGSFVGTSFWCCHFSISLSERNANIVLVPCVCSMESALSRAHTVTRLPLPSLPVIPKVTKHLLSNPVFTCIILAACMEIAVVAGFAAFLGKYLEQQFNLTTSSANQLLGE